MTFPQLPSPPPMVKSFLLGLSGAMIAYLGQWLTATDFGVFTPLVAAFAPVLINYLTKLRQGGGKDDGGEDDTPSGGVVPNPTPLPVDPLGIEALLKQLFPPVPTKSFAAMGVVELDRGSVMITPRGVCMAQLQPTPAGVKWLPQGLLALLLGLMATGCQTSVADYGRPPRAVISGPSRGEPGEFLEFSSRSSAGSPSHVRWTINPELKGRKQLSGTEDPSITVAGFPGVYVLTLSVSNRWGVDTTSRQYVVDGRQPTPPPEPKPVDPDPIPPAPVPVPDPVKPVPPPEPVPVPPPGKTFGIAAKISSTAKAINRPNRSSELAGVISEARAVAKAMQAGTLEPTPAINQIAAALGKLPADYKPLLLLIVTEIKRVYGEGLLNSTADYAAFFLEAAAALESVA